MTLIFISLMVGCPLIGWLSDYYQTRKRILIISALFSFILTLAFLQTDKFMYIVILSFLMGLFSSAQSISYLVILKSNVTTIIATSMSLSNVLIMVEAASMELMISPMLGITSEPIAMIMLPTTSLLALLIALAAQETYSNRKL